MRRVRVAQSPLWPLAFVAGIAIAVVGVVFIVLTPVVLRDVLDWVHDTRVAGIRVAGELLGLSESQDVYTIVSALPGNVPRLADPEDVCTGLYQQTATSVACVPFSVENATMNFALQSVGAGAALAVNGTNHVRGLVVTGRGNSSAAVVGDDVVLTIDAGIGLCGACTAGQTLRLGANGTCYDCYTVSSALPLVAAGDVAVETRANDTRVYTVPWTWMTDPMPSTFAVLAYAFISGSYSVTVLPPGVPGNLENTTMYKLDMAMNAQVQLDVFTPNPELGAAIIFTNIASYFPAAVTNPILDRFHSAGYASCAYYNGATPLYRSFGGYGVHNNVGTYAFYFPNLDSTFNPTLGRCELRIELWLASP